MPPSARKDHVYAVGVHKAPPQLSKKEFEDKVNAMMDEALAFPVVKRNIVKLEIMFHNDRLDDHLKFLEFPHAEPTAIVMVQSETLDHLIEAVRDPEVQNLFDRAKEFCLQCSTSAFCVDVVPKSNWDSSDSSTSRDAHAIGIYKAPRNLSAEDYTKKMHALLDAWVGLSGIQKHGAKYELWLPNNAVFEDFRALGLSMAEPFYFIHGESETLEQMMEDMKDAEAQKLVIAANNEFGLSVDSCLFAVDVVAKIGKS
ncbi:hypothetical protein MVEN_02145200 [Mycena venus]|uniref:Uncharacterized protein n=1 Tax=Mycena venus TaxID=2733690 RepID=A0A8H6X9E7_9AGAR|nr:hypothetical protein MVEN_02145200 [Mycena venus]